MNRQFKVPLNAKKYFIVKLWNGRQFITILWNFAVIKKNLHNLLKWNIKSGPEYRHSIVECIYLEIYTKNRSSVVFQKQIYAYIEHGYFQDI